MNPVTGLVFGGQVRGYNDYDVESWFLFKFCFIGKYFSKRGKMNQLLRLGAKYEY